MSDDLVKSMEDDLRIGCSASIGDTQNAVATLKAQAAEITRLGAACDAYFRQVSLMQMKHARHLPALERRIARQRRALAKLYQRRHDKNAALATARREGMEEAAKRLEKLHKNHNYDPESGTLTRKLGRYDRWPEAAKTAKLEHDAGYYRAIAEGVAHIRAAAGEVKP